MWKVIQQIRSTKGTNAKKTILENHPELQPVLRAAYNPFTQYGITPPASGGFGDEQLTEDKSYALLNRLSSGKLSGNAAKKEVVAHLNELDYGSFQIMRCILNKSFDIGLAEKSINEVFPNLIPTHPIQLAKPVDWNRVKFPCLISLKLDGLRAIWRGGVFYSRKGHTLEGLHGLSLQLLTMFDKAKVKPFALDGELMVPGVHFNEISGKIRSFQETPDAVYHVFDAPDEDLPLLRRYVLLESVFDIGARDLYGPTLVRHTMVYNQKDAERFYESARDRQYEGAILKDPNALYENTRSWAWQKLKATETADCRVTGLYQGQGKYDGLVGGLYVDFRGVRVGVGSGLTDLQRNTWADEPEEIIGKVVEVAFQEVTPDGSLRHPRLIKIRGDLS